MLGMLCLRREGQWERQHDAGHRHHSELEIACHPALPLSPSSDATSHQPHFSELRRLLIGIDIRLHLQIIEQIKIRIQIFVLVECL
jgi:hypothetical protein